jgi:hypothetical protein
MNILLRKIVVIGAALLLSGCYEIFTSAVNSYNDAVTSREMAQRDRDTSALVSWIKGLQQAADPLGDYYWARLNESSRLKEHAIEKYQVREFYESAAARGVEDAKLVLALKEFRSAKESGNELLWSKKLQDLDYISEKQCWYREPRVSLAKNELCVVRVAVTDEVLHEFIHSTKHSNIRDYWRKKNQTCIESQDYQEAIRNRCRPFQN